jgi:hypothetical protein
MHKDVHNYSHTLGKLKSLGFDDYAMDYVAYPDGMRWFLQSTLNLHRTVNTGFHKRRTSRSLTLAVGYRSGSSSGRPYSCNGDAVWRW